MAYSTSPSRAERVRKTAYAACVAALVVGGIGAVDTLEPISDAQAQSVSDTEKLFWESIKDSTDPADFRDYIYTFPDGVFKLLAERRIKRYSGGGGTAQPVQTGKPAQRTGNGGNGGVAVGTVPVVVEQCLNQGWFTNAPKVDADWKRDIDICKKAIAQTPNNGDVIATMAVAYEKTGSRQEYGRMLADAEKQIGSLSSAMGRLETALGRAYRGKTPGFKEDHSTVVAYYRRALEKGEPVSSQNLGYQHLNGLGVPKSKSKACETFKIGVSLDWADSIINYARECLSKIRDKEAQLRKAAELGSSRAVYELGKAYLKAGRRSDAAESFQRASDQGNANASMQLGYTAFKSKDFEKARKYFYRAVRTGNAFAHYRTGAMEATWGNLGTPDTSRGYFGEVKYAINVNLNGLRLRGGNQWAAAYHIMMASKISPHNKWLKRQADKFKNIDADQRGVLIDLIKDPANQTKTYDEVLGVIEQKISAVKAEKQRAQKKQLQQQANAAKNKAAMESRLKHLRDSAHFIRTAHKSYLRNHCDDEFSDVDRLYKKTWSAHEFWRTFGTSTISTMNRMRRDLKRFDRCMSGIDDYVDDKIEKVLKHVEIRKSGNKYRVPRDLLPGYQALYDAADQTVKDAEKYMKRMVPRFNKLSVELENYCRPASKRCS